MSSSARTLPALNGNKVQFDALVPGSSSPRSPSTGSPTAADKNVLILGAGSRRRSTYAQQRKSASSPIRNAPTNPEEAELLSLKSKLHTQERRIQDKQQQQLTPHRPASGANGRENAALTSPTQLRGRMYSGRPYERVQPRIMWEPFNNDPDVEQLNEAISLSEQRMRSRKEEMEVGWRLGRRNPQASIPPPEPKVFAAAEEEFLPLVKAAEKFADDQHLRFRSQVQDDGDDIQSAVSDGTSQNASPNADQMYNSRRSSNSLNRLGSKRSMRLQRGSIHKTDTTTAILKQLDGLPSININLPSPAEIEVQREGDILSNTVLLKRDLFEAAFTRKDQVGVMSGAPYFRMVPKFNVGGCAQGHISGIRSVLNEISKVYRGKIVWVNLREEPVLYINGRSHIIRNAEDPTHPVVIPGINPQRLNKMEHKLKQELLSEASVNNGNVLIHKESANGAIDELWEAVQEDSVQTLPEVFSDYEQHGVNVVFERQPITQTIGPQLVDFDQVFDRCMEYPQAPMMYNCQTGRGRSSLMMMLTTITRFYQHCTKDVELDVSLMKGDGKAFSFRTLLKLVSLLPDGALHERRVAILAELSDKIYNVGDKVHRVFASGKEIDKAALYRLQQYAYLITYSAYCERRLWSREFDGSFTQFLDSFPEIKNLIQSITAKTRSYSDAKERMETPSGGDRRDEKEAVMMRRGQVLSSNMVLRSYSKDVIGVQPSSIPGVVSLRQVSTGAAVYTVGRTNDEGMESLVYAVRNQFNTVRRIQWVNVRAEPQVYINNEPYLLLDYHSILESTDGDDSVTLHISADRIEEIEHKLKQDVLAESERHNGVLLIHEQDEEGTVTAKRIHVGSVQTPRQHLQAIADFAGGVSYHRVPFPYGVSLTPEDIDPLLKVCNEFEEDDGLVFSDNDGTLRTTICVNVACAHRFATQEKLRNVFNVENIDKVLSVQGGDGLLLSSSPFYGGMEESENFSEASSNTELIVASTLAQMLAAGTFIPAVRSLITFCGRGAKWNLLEAIDAARRAMESSSGEAKTKNTAIALQHVRSYLLVFLSSIYLDDVDDVSEVSFSAWIERLMEVRFILDNLETRPAKTLKYVVASNIMAAHSMERAVDRRNGNVLTANFGMKADHFPGCQKKGLTPAISGAPNFRKVPMVNVFGVAIPTKTGVYNLLHVLGASDAPLTLYPGDVVDPVLHTGFPQRGLICPEEVKYDAPLRGNVLWFNLREEPIVYVGDRPFVFRDLSNYMVNVELTGIETAKIEGVEVKLKKDILDEAQRYDGRFLVHDEGNPGELVGMWETATPQSVMRVREVYEEAAAEGCRVRFERLPVTDEQSPEYRDFDQLVEMLLPTMKEYLQKDEPISFVFNCQMGRGRTTTGMVVCCLLLSLICPNYIDELKKAYPSLWEADATPWAKGNYKCILQLRTVLGDGRAAKQRLDLVLEACNKMQNLRAAIELFKNQVESVDLPEESRGRAHFHGVHYLQRYFNLICFSSYMYEEFDRETGSFASTFVEWMESRAELGHLHDSAALI